MRRLTTGRLSYLITRGDVKPFGSLNTNNDILDTISASVDAGISLIQIREKHLSGRRLFELTAAVMDITAGSETKVLVNDRADIAMAAGADGVHLTTTSVSAAVIRRAFGRDIIIGVSAHTLKNVLNAKADDADFSTFGPVFMSPGKGDPTGLEVLRTVCRAAGEFPVMALGGIDASNLSEVFEVGAAGYAAIRFLNDRAVLSGMGEARMIGLK